jgi:sulfotransferase family protein
MRAIVEIKTDPVRFASDTRVSQPVMVCSHERSGTHFLINSIAKNSLHTNNPYLRYDLVPLGSFLNFHDTREVKAFFERLAQHSCASIIKCHFAASFFLGQHRRFLLDGLCKIIYIVRDPIELMLSYHRFINYFTSREGPKRSDAFDFLVTPPEGQMLRYQEAQASTILDRWQAHLLGWLKLAEENSSNVLVVKYEDLDRNHADVTRKVLSFLGLDHPDVIQRPDPIHQTVHIPNVREVPFELREKIREYISGQIDSTCMIKDLYPEVCRRA